MQERLSGAVKELTLRMMSLQDKSLFRLYALEVQPAQADQISGSQCEASQMEAVRKLLDDAQSGIPVLSLSIGGLVSFKDPCF